MQDCAVRVNKLACDKPGDGYTFYSADDVCYTDSGTD